jgi:thioredoxin 1
MMMYLFTKRLYKYFIQLMLVAGLSFAGTAYYPHTATSGFPSHIVFIENSFDEALKQAALKHKYIFVDAYTSWCGPCKMLKVTTFNNSKAAEFYNNNFVNVSIDMEKGQGPLLAARWGLKAVPTLIIFDSQGKPVLGTEGFMKADDLIRFGKQALSKAE